KLTIADRTIPLDNGSVKLKYYGSTDLYHDYYFYDTLKLYNYINELYTHYKEFGKGNITYNDLFNNSKNIHLVRKELEKNCPELIKKLTDNDIDSNPPEAFKDKIVILVSMVSGGKRQLIANPFTQDDPGAHAHGTFINNFINNDFLYKASKYYTILAIFILALVIAFISLNYHPYKIVIPILLSLLALIAIGTYLLYNSNITIDAFTLLTGILSPYFLTLIITHIFTHNELKQREQTIFKLSTHIHNNLKNKLESAKEFYEIYSKTNNKVHLNKIYKMLILSSQECKNLLFLFHKKECMFHDLAEEMKFRASQKFKNKDLLCDFEIGNINLKLSFNAVHDALDIYNEVLNNIDKHSKANKASIKLTSNNKYLFMSVKDNGVGFDIHKSQAKKGSYGLKLMSQLAKNNKHDLDIESSKNGTLINLRIKK
ncbi:MAG: CHASE2 domain-containing protein, partial [bacterium]|nr:CHASE2 domain-containing protein [bacterium]